jgi:dTDP-4-amino-4,6-dideoxygalactose transaminase
MGICNLRHIEQSIASRKAVFDRYMERLSGVKGITIPGEQPDVVWNYAYMPVLFDKAEFGKSRDQVFEELKQQDIIAAYMRPIYQASENVSTYPSLNALTSGLLSMAANQTTSRAMACGSIPAPAKYQE